MIKVKKYFSLLVIAFIILSNLAFAESSSSTNSDGSFEDNSKEIHSKENEIMERFMKGEATDDEMRAMAKEKMGSRFSEEEFKRGMMELKDRMSRKEAFSYEKEGIEHRYDFGPSYEGYSKEQMIFGRIFEHIGDDIDPREIKQFCNDTGKIADIVIQKFKEKVGDLQVICKQFEENEAKCSEASKKFCSQIGTAMVKESATEMEKRMAVAYSCPVNKDAIVEACKIRSKGNMEERMKHISESCEKRFDFQGERLLQECEGFKEHQICDKEKFISKCMGGIKKEDFERKVCPETTIPQCSEGTSVQKKADANGCVYYYCAATSCPSVQKPTCNTGETLQPYYDNAGCVTSYQCIKQTTTCPEVSKPTCGERQSLTTKYDDKQCIVGYECISVTTTNTSSNTITGYAVFSTYDDYLKQCENSWIQQQKICANTPSACDKETFIEKCKEQENKNSADYSAKIEQHCESDTLSEIKHAEQRCLKIDEERQRCFEKSAKRCEQMKGLADKCKETLTEEKLRKFIIEEATKRCKFSDIIENEDEVRKAEKAEIVLAVLNTATQDDLEKLKLFVDDLKEELKLQDTTVYKGIIEPDRFGDVKLLPFVVNAKLSAFESSERAKEVKEKIVAGQKSEDIASKLVSLRDSDVPKEYLYIIEDKASDVLNVSDKLSEIEKKEGQKGIGYKIRLFFGLAKQAEKEEITQLGESKEKLKNSIDVLTKLVDEVPSDVAKSILKEQIESLKKQQDGIKALIEAKEKKAKGLFGIFG